MNYTELTIDFSNYSHPISDIDELLNSSGCLGASEFDIDEQEVDRILGNRAYSGGDIPSEVIDEVELACSSSQKNYFFDEIPKELVTKLKSIDGLEISINKHPVEDWNNKWRESYKPIEVSHKILVVPSWVETFGEHETTVRIYPGMGFGTGTHETTYLCLKLFSEITDRGRHLRSCLDFGCGSGILGIAFLLSGGKSCDLVDIDEGALINTRQNLELNTLDEDSKVRVLTSHQRAKINNEYNLIFANILQNVLFLEKGFLTNSISNNGLLVLSGLLINQVEETIAYYENASNMEHLKTITKGDWAAILLRRK